MREPQSILITGASSGIGEALAAAYARPGVRLALSGRDEARLAAVAESCRGRGAVVRPDVVDVTDGPAMARWIDAVDTEGALDLVIANAGISAGTFDAGESADQARAILAVNLDGVFNTVLPAIPHLKRRRRGQIALMSSLASFRGFPGAPAYCASKAAVRVWGEALRGELAPHGVGVSVICPGFIVSRMTAGNSFPMPFLMQADRAADIIRKGLARNRPRIAFPGPMYAGSWLLALMPQALTDSIMPRLPKKR